MEFYTSDVNRKITGNQFNGRINPPRFAKYFITYSTSSNNTSHHNQTQLITVNSHSWSFIDNQVKGRLTRQKTIHVSLPFFSKILYTLFLSNKNGSQVLLWWPFFSDFRITVNNCTFIFSLICLYTAPIINLGAEMRWEKIKLILYK